MVAYDIPSDRRRTRLVRLLQRFLEPVHKSVFEGSLEAGKVDRLRSAVDRVIDRNEDTVRIFTVCRRCRVLTEVLGLDIEIQEDRGDIII
ncbi:MAG: CRISPR-associated endonuclease Cas2 [Thermoanaerobaculia bacterium]|nr:CRISPR-associated endonuclease Cas2 [Thermoanaerobaculia bacterium]